MDVDGHDRAQDRTTVAASSRLASAPSLNRLWADLLVEELVRQGVGLFVLAPGSRSTPLASAVAARPETPHLVHFDERGGAFAALGWARATGRPACWITTSGTAVANGLPAVVEAAVDGVPLLCLTADRPPELRQTGANQTIEQPGIFGGYVRWGFDLPAPSPEIPPAFVLSTAAQAVHRALGPPAGPVHLNAMFREPLAPDPDGRDLPELPARWREGEAPFTQYLRPASVEAHALGALADRLGGVERGLVVAGRLATRAEGEAALRLADALGWPLLPDVGSQVRLGTDHPAACPYFDLALASPAFRQRHAPEAVVYLGGRATSKRLASLLAEARPDPLVVVRNDPHRFDPDHGVTHRVEAEVGAVCHALRGRLAPRAPGPWAAAWREASEAAGAAVDARLAGASPLDPSLPHSPTPPLPVSEPGVARALSRLLPEGSGLVLAASMPVRDADAFAAPDGPPALVASNRGASGIDGTVATAAGLARGLGRGVTLLVGDLALLHDLNSLALLRDPAQPPVTLVAVNNDGGGIFHFLPIARHAEVFEPFVATPHGMGFEDAARMFGLAYARPETAGDFEATYAEASASGRSALIEVRTERRANHALHAALLAEASAAVEQALSEASPP
jgi:2-succinyl-5-enolpyruvyl-6-hydroxy-3-cyclohexene-1-carboxylate synthase